MYYNLNIFKSQKGDGRYTANAEQRQVNTSSSFTCNYNFKSLELEFSMDIRL